MPENLLQVRLEAIEQHTGHFTLTFDSSQYPVIVNPAANVTFSDWLRRLSPVLTGQIDPARQLAPQKLLHNVGIWLWQALLPESAPAQERDALARALRTGQTPLLLTLPDTLAGLPWELLCDPQQPGDRGFIAHRRPLMRFHSSAMQVTPITPPLRVLLLISSPLSLGEDSRVDVESERVAVEQATRNAREAGLLHLFVEDIVTPRRVQQALVRFKPHIVHYIGHGGYNEASGGSLLWEDEQGNELPFAAERLADLLRPRHLHAMVLHACQTGRSNARTEVLGIAGTLTHEGIPTVLAQQANFTYESSQRASEAWYTALTAGQSFVEALFEVRQALSQADRPDWVVPILQGSAASLAPVLDVTALPGSPDPQLTSAGATIDLPTPTGVFVGRHRELRALRIMLESVPGSGPVLALITGPGGVGKSTLAAQAVTRYGRTYKAVLTLHCQDYQAIDLFLQRIGEFLKWLGRPDFLEQCLPDPKLSTEAKVEEAIVVLDAGGPVLLVIDSLESVQNDNQTISDKALLHLLQKLLTNLRSGRVLITGRYAVKDLLPQGRFAVNLRHLDLDDLSPYETNQLLARHPTLAHLGETIRQTLIREFGGLPYVYDLLSSEAASQNLDLLLADVQGRITRERAQRSAEEWSTIRRHVVEFAALEATIARLSTSSRALLARLSVLRRPFPLDALRQGLSASRIDWQALLDWSLMRYDPTACTYRLHSLTQHYAHDSLLADPERVQTQGQLAAWYEHYADHDSHNLADYLEAHYLYRASGDVQHAAELTLSLAEVLRRFGLYSLLRELYMMTAQDMRGCDESLMVRALHQLGNITQLQGNYAEARHLYQQNLAMDERLGDVSGQAHSLLQLGTIAQSQGDYVEARRLYRQSLALFQQLDSVGGQASSLHQLGMLARMQGDYPEAYHLSQQSLEMRERLSDVTGQAQSLHQLGTIAQLRGDYAEARRLYRQSLALFQQLGDVHGQAQSLHNLGIIAQLQEDYAEARRLYQRSLEVKERLGDVDGQAQSLHQLGTVAQSLGDYTEAHRLYQRSLAMFRQLGDVHGQANSLAQLGALVYEQEDFEQALTYTIQALLLFKALHTPASSVAQRMIDRIRNQMDETAFLVRWRTLASELPVPVPQERSQEEVFLTRLVTLCDEVVVVLRSGDAVQQGALADYLSKMMSGDLPVEDARGFLRLLVAWLLGQDAQALMSQAEQLWQPLSDAFVQMVAAVEEPQRAEDTVLTVEQLPGVVSSAILQGTTEQRQDLAAGLMKAQQQLVPEEASLNRFLGCLIAALQGEMPEEALLEPPFTELWQEFQDTLSMSPDKSSQQEERKDV